TTPKRPEHYAVRNSAVDPFTLVALYSVPSRHIAYKMPATRRATATTATRPLRRRPIRSPHSQSGRVVRRLGVRMTARAVWTSTQRVRLLPVFVIGPRRCVSLELHSRGTSP